MLSRRGVAADRQADWINRRVRLGGQAAARAVGRGSFSPPPPFFAPVASARRLEMLSIRTDSSAGVSAMAWNSRSRTPACDQREDRA